MPAFRRQLFKRADVFIGRLLCLQIAERAKSGSLSSFGDDTCSFSWKRSSQKALLQEGKSSHALAPWVSIGR